MQLLLTERIRVACRDAMLNPKFCKTHETEARRVVESSPSDFVGVSISLLREVSRCLDKTCFHELVKGTEVYVEPRKEKKKDPKFEAYLDNLRSQRNEREYSKMVSSVVPDSQRNMFRFRPDDIKEIKSHVAAIFNILFSMISVYLAVYLATRTMLEDIGLRVLLSLAGALIIGTVEALLYVKYSHIMSPKPKKNTPSVS